MKIAVVIIRVVIGGFLTFGAIAFFANLIPQPELQGNVKAYMDGIMTVQMMPIVKAVELLCGIAFLVGRYVALANIVIFPIFVNVLLFHIFLAPETLVIALLFFAANLFLFYAYRKHYTSVFAARRIE